MEKIYVKSLSKRNTQWNTGVEPKRVKYWKTELGESKLQISQEGLALIKKFEGCELEAYLCPAGVWTIGYGHTKDVKEGDKINKDEADYLLQEEMIEYESYINDMVDVDLNQSQYDSLCAWVYNLGPSNLGSSTMLRVLNEGKYDEVPQQMKRWNKANGEVLDGLIRRREAEALLFQGKEWSEV
tara:strand:- start:876 stop:1427 length:552 start_codon:yes stop_codon:yes gene_type:complete